MKLEPDDVFLAQGTLRPDLIESASLLASTNAHVIKTHHNDTQLVRQLREQVCRISPPSILWELNSRVTFIFYFLYLGHKPYIVLNTIEILAIILNSAMFIYLLMY